jgi:hypothetical protein
MFGRLRETIRVLSYREPTHVPDAAIVEAVSPAPTRAGTAIVRFIEGLVIIITVGFVAEFSILHLNHLIPTDKHSSAFLVAVSGSLGALMTLFIGWIRHDLERQLQGKLHLEKFLAPFFGNKLDRTCRVLKAKPRAH